MDQIDNIVSPKRVVFLSMITWGLYDFFWFIKNWKIIKAKENLNIHPYARSFFAIFYCGSLFKKFIDNAKKHGYISKYSVNKITTYYVLLTFIGVILGKSISGMGWWALLFSIIGLFGAMPLFEIQKAINFTSEHESGVTDFGNSYSFSEVSLVIFGILYTIFILIGPYISQQLSYQGLM